MLHTFFIHCCLSQSSFYYISCIASCIHYLTLVLYFNLCAFNVDISFISKILLSQFKDHTTLACTWNRAAQKLHTQHCGRLSHDITWNLLVLKKINYSSNHVWNIAWGFEPPPRVLYIFRTARARQWFNCFIVCRERGEFWLLLQIFIFMVQRSLMLLSMGIK